MAPKRKATGDVRQSDARICWRTRIVPGGPVFFSGLPPVGRRNARGQLDHLACAQHFDREQVAGGKAPQGSRDFLAGRLVDDGYAHDLEDDVSAEENGFSLDDDAESAGMQPELPAG